MVRTRVDRDGTVTVVVSTSDVRQMRQLRRLWHRLSDDPALRVIDGRMDSEGAGLLIVSRAADPQKPFAFGQFKTA
jgi:hypothetical protein